MAVCGKRAKLLDISFKTTLHNLFWTPSKLICNEPFQSNIGLVVQLIALYKIVLAEAVVVHLATLVDAV
jgi:hypothetical protein